MSSKEIECSCQSGTNKIAKKKHVLNYGPHSEIDIWSCDACGFARYVCNECKHSHKKLRDFKHVQCLIKNLRGRHDHECDYLQSNILYF